jgi:hypothetical protein
MRSNRLMKGVFAVALGMFLFLPVVTAYGQYPQYPQDWRVEQRRQQRQERRRERRDARRGWAWGNYNNWGGSFELRQTALNAGYNEGIKEGRKDRRNGDRFNFYDESDYRNASKDYNSSRFGNRALYQRFFRQGFENGYRDGWNGY